MYIHDHNPGGVWEDLGERGEGGGGRGVGKERTRTTIIK